MEIKNIVNQLVKKYGTRDPFILAKARGMRICKKSLGKIYGYSSTYKRIMSIHINSEYPEEIQRLVCAHELAYLLMYPKSTCHVVLDLSGSKNPDFEKYIKLFMAHLLISDEMLKKYIGEKADRLAECEGIPLELVQVRLNS
ncbi:ImmA/IrrE family metallo-endopeptidase [Clostridium sp. B9]|uniref:ImmA/IrrE family metallo-endopeptidase n=1 Tax=Clostridium sp. B9 TaxID=3423224 RepID=UPI003D2EDE01